MHPKTSPCVRRALALALLLSASCAAAQQQEIVVTGNGLDGTASDAVYGAVTLDRAALDAAASNRLEEILKDVAGFQLFRRSDAASANPTSQGATLRALGGNAASRIVLTLDEVPQADPFGGWISWPAFDPRRLGVVRVVRGGGSVVHGPGAIAGTIALESVTPAEAPGLQAELSYGSRDSIDAFAGYGRRIGNAALTLALTHAHGDGFIPVVPEQQGEVDRPAHYRQSSASARALVPLAAGAELQLNALHFRDRRERGLPFTGNETKGTDASVRLVGERWSALAYLQGRDYYNSFASVNAARSTVSQTAEQYSVPSTGIGARGEWRPRVGASVELRIGGDWRSTVGETREYYAFQNGEGTRAREAGGRSRIVGVFADFSWSTERVTLTGGARIDRWRIEDGFLDERVRATEAVLTATNFPDRAGWEPTLRAGVLVKATDDLSVRAAGYMAWRLPTLNELYRPFRVGADATAANAALAPERMRGFEAGVEYRIAGPITMSATVFANRLHNAIANVTLGSGPGSFPGVGFVVGQFSRRDNLDAIDARGVEIDASLALAGNWRAVAGYSFVNAQVEASGAAASLNGLRPAQTPRHSLSASIGWNGQGGARGNLGVRYSGSRYEDDLNRERLAAAITLDASGAVPLSKQLAIEARAENITAARVEAGIANGIIERATPRTLWLGLRWRG